MGCYNGFMGYVLLYVNKTKILSPNYRKIEGLKKFISFPQLIKNEGQGEPCPILCNFYMVLFLKNTTNLTTA